MATNLLKLMKSEIKKKKESSPSLQSTEISSQLTSESLIQSLPSLNPFHHYTDFMPLPLSELGKIPSLYYSPSFVNPEMAQYLQSCIECEGNKNPDTWKILRTRRLQCWESSLPSWLLSLTDYLLQQAIFDPSTCTPDHFLINQYTRGQGIPHHTDGPKYVNRVAILSLGSPCLMTFRRRLQAAQIGVEYEGDLFSVLLQPRSLLVFSDAIYSEYMHGIHDVECDVVGADGKVPCLNRELAGKNDGDVIERGDRLSLTIRRLL